MSGSNAQPESVTSDPLTVTVSSAPSGGLLTTVAERQPSSVFRPPLPSTATAQTRWVPAAAGTEIW